MVSLRQIREHTGHSHSHSHSHKHDNTYLISANRNDAGVKITRIGLFVNLGMAIFKGIGGWLFHSQALIADAFHALTDLVSDFMTLATISWSLKPPSDRFPYGYGKIESLGALGVSGILLFGGTAMALNGFDAIYVQFYVDPAHFAHEEHTHGLFSFFGHSHAHTGGIPNLNAAWLAAGSIAIKEWLYRATMKVAKERKSSVLASNAVHHRIDSLTSIVALLTIGGSHVLTDASWLDPVGGLIISMMIIKAGWNNTMSALLELGDVSVDEEIKDSVGKSTKRALLGKAIRGVPGVPHGDQVQIRDIQGVKSGQNYLMDIDLAVPSTLTVSDIGAIEEAVRERVGLKVRGVRKVRVKFSAIEESRDFDSEFVAPDINPLSDPEPQQEDADHEMHEHANDHTHDHEREAYHKKTK